MRKLVTVVALVAVTAVGCGTATPSALNQMGQVQQTRSHYEEDDPQWNCQLDGDKHCGHVPACWTEHKRDLPDERLCGFADHAALNSDGWVFGDYMHDTHVR